MVRDPINCPEVGGSWEARGQGDNAGRFVGGYYPSEVRHSTGLWPWGSRGRTWNKGGEDLARAMGGVLHDAEGVRGGPGALCGVGPPFLGPQAHSEGGFGIRAHTSDGPHQCLAGVDKPTGSVGAGVGSGNV